MSEYNSGDNSDLPWITTTTTDNTGPYIWDDNTGALTIAPGKNYIDDAITIHEDKGIQINGDNGRWDLEDRIKTIEKVVGIPSRDYNLEQKHPHLKEMFDNHIRKIQNVLHECEEYEAECKKLRTWETLSKDGSSKT